MTESTTFGTWLELYRLQRGLDMGSLADSSGVDRSTIYRLERGGAQPTVCTAVRLCAALDVGPEELARVLQGRQLTSHLVTPTSSDNPVLTVGDITSFVQLARRDPLRARTLLAELLNLVAGAYEDFLKRAKESHGASSDLLPNPFQVSQSHIDLLLNDSEFVRSELQLPPQADGQFVLELYRRGGAITLRDVGAYIRWLRQQQKKSLVEIEKPIGASDSVLSRIETGGLEKIRLNFIMKLDQELHAEGEVLRMCWAACRLFPTIIKQGATHRNIIAHRLVWSEREYRYAQTLLAITRWWSYLQPGDSSIVVTLRKECSAAV